MSETIALGDLVEIKGGGTPARAVPEYWGGSVPWATVKDFKSTVLDTTLETITLAAVSESATNVIPAGTVIIPTRMAVGKAAISTMEMAINQDLKALLPKGEIAPRFLLHFLLSKARFLEDRAQGATVKGIKLDLLRSLRFPKIPLAEQLRVASALDKANCIRGNCEQALAEANALIISTFLKRFGDPLTNRKGLPKVAIRELGTVVTGNTPPRRDVDNYGNVIEWIKSDNINTPGHLLTRSAEYLSEVGRVLGRTAPAGSTLVTCIAGSPSVIGNAALTDREVAFNQQINAVIPHQTTDPNFLYCQFLVGKALIQAHSTNSMKGMVSKGKFQEIKFLRPSFREQSEFGEVFAKILGMMRSMQEAYDNSQQLSECVSARVFRGEL